MVRILTVDSSVIIASLLAREPRHAEAGRIWRMVMDGEAVAIMPYAVMVEVVSAVRRRTASEDLAKKVGRMLREMDSISFVSLDRVAAEEAAEIAAVTGLRGMDAVIVQVSRAFRAELVSFDEEMMKKAAALP